MRFILNSILGILVIINFTLQGKELDADEILRRVDACLNAPEDQQMRMKLVIEEQGRIDSSEVFIIQKGAEKRLGKFLAPASKRGIGFLCLPQNITYVYLPAYKKVRRVASQLKNSKFAGTDFTYEDLEAKKYSLGWQARILKKDSSFYHLELTPKKNTVTFYSKLVVVVDTQNFYPVVTEYYDRTGRFYKKMTATKIEKISGFWISKESIVEDFLAKRKTRMILEDIKFNTKISDDKFTERYLTQ
ncbi:MAG: outer membrane lipoprotein-sorting protein [candidate division WOR-3 bacterium]|nr:outer membrane lipoprotein-sorting protein [candidate division WOR-3 bacterium]MDW7987643.1 outer membrane lipoprotein-sorting protein [candidate division WOR-3 bacterium]